MEISKDYQIDKKVFKNSYINDINIFKKLSGLNSNLTLNNISKISIKKKYYNEYEININKKINNKDINLKYVFSEVKDNNIFLWQIMINTKYISIRKYYDINSTEIYGMDIYSYNNKISNYQKSYNFYDNKLNIWVPSPYFTLNNFDKYYDDLQTYNIKNKISYIINNEIYDTFPINTKKYNKILNYIEHSNEINLKKMRIYIIELYKNNELTIVQIKKLMNIINGRILMLYLIN